MARFFVPKKNFHGDRAGVTGEELEHMRRVLRLRPGDRVVLFDDAGWEHQGIIRSYSDRLGEIEIAQSSRPEREAPLDVSLAQAVGKGEKMDWVVEKATELGVGKIVPFFTSRTLPKLDRAKAEARRERWRKIALSAAKQSGRTRVPEILEPCDFPDLVGRPWPCELKLIFWEGESSRGLARVREERERVESLLLAIGPEGGFSAEEISLAEQNGFDRLRLGKRILRTETAALAALALAQFLWGDLG